MNLEKGQRKPNSSIPKAIVASIGIIGTCALAYHFDSVGVLWTLILIAIVTEQVEA